MMNLSQSQFARSQSVGFAGSFAPLHIGSFCHGKTGQRTLFCLPPHSHPRQLMFPHDLPKRSAIFPGMSGRKRNISVTESQ